MLLDSFEVENFRSLKYLKLEKLARVNLLVGKNNSGKTSVLEALYALVGVGTASWLEEIVKIRGLSILQIDYAQLFYKFNSSKKIGLKGYYREKNYDEAYKMWLQAELSMAGANARQLTTESEWEDEQSFQKAEEGPLQIEVKTDSMVVASKYEITLSGRTLPRLRIVDEKYGAGEPAKGFRSVRLFRTYASFISSHSYVRSPGRAIESLKIRKLDDELVRVLRQIDNRIERVELVRGGVYVNLGIDFPRLLPINLMGEGIQRIVSIVAAVISRSNGIVLIDELDNGLHYSVLRVLWKAMLYAAREYDVQLVISTHSAEALRHLTWVLDEEDGKQYRDDVAAYTLIRADDDTVRTYRHDYEQLDYALDHGMEIRN